MAEARRRAGERGAAAAARRETFSARVLRRHPAPVEPVVERRRSPRAAPRARRPARTPGRRRRSRRACTRGGRAGQRPGLGLALAEVAPVGIGGGEAEPGGLGGDVDDAGAGHRAEGGELAGRLGDVVVHGSSSVARRSAAGEACGAGLPRRLPRRTTSRDAASIRRCPGRRWPVCRRCAPRRGRFPGGPTMARTMWRTGAFAAGMVAGIGAAAAFRSVRARRRTSRTLPQEPLPRVVIVGAGFGGPDAAHVLCAARRSDVTVVDRRNHHLFQPLLYQVATAALEPGRHRGAHPRACSATAQRAGAARRR